MTTLSLSGPHTLSKLASLASYSKDERTQACEFSPALARYLTLLTRPRTELDAQALLRLSRHEAWCEAVLATFFHNASPEEICFEWSLAAEALISKAWEMAGGGPEDFIILALGKLGSRELNLSSDIDLVFVRRDHKTIDLKILKSFTTNLSTLSEFAYCLRVDLNLRPGGGAGSPLTSQTEFEYHYGYHGEMWERLSYVRARFIYGDPKLAEEVLKFANHFSYRKHIDLTLVDDLAQLRSKIHHEMSLKDPRVFNLKLSPGGIRDLELFVHSLQLIHGGKNKALQTQSTSAAICGLKEHSFISLSDAQFLHESYWQLRDVENHLQAKEDQQTYSIERAQSHYHQFQVSKLLQLASQIHLFVSNLLQVDLKNTMPTELVQQQEWLAKKGFSEACIKDIWPELIAAKAQSLKSERDERSRLHFLESFVEHIARIDRNKNLALALLYDFIKATRAKASLYSLLNREEKLTEALAWLFSCSPYLANIFVLRPELIDSLFFNAQADLPEAEDEFLEMLIERRLIVEVLSAQKFLKDKDLHNLSRDLSFSADEICKSILKKIADDLKCEPVNILCLGKWGGRELGFRSDLDFIFLTENDPSPLQHKLSRKFISWLNQHNRGGVIYNIDTRLRPSGHAGPLLVSKSQLESFLQKNAEPWERQAYLRARPLLPTAFSASQIAGEHIFTSDDDQRLREIRAKLLTKDESLFDLKFQFGGLVDIEFACQTALLKRSQFSLDSSTQGMIQYLMEQDPNWKVLGPSLLKNYNDLRTVEQMHQLTSAQSQTKLRKNSENILSLAVNMGMSTEFLDSHLTKLFLQNSQILGDIRGEK